MSYTAKATSQYELTDITVTKANGHVVRLGKPGTLNFKIRLALYKRKNR